MGARITGFLDSLTVLLQTVTANSSCTRIKFVRFVRLLKKKTVVEDAKKAQNYGYNTI